NFLTFNATRGVVSTPENFIFNPASYNILTETNSATARADYAVNEKSTLSFSGSHSYLNYPQYAVYRGALSKQQRVSENITYSHKVTHQGGWTLAYTGAYSDFRGAFENAHTHVLSAGYFREIGRHLTLRLEAGPTYVQTAGASGSYMGFNAQVSVQKPVKTNTLSMYYAHETGQSTGLGYVSDNDRAGLGVSRPIGQSATLFIDVGVFDIRSQLGSAYSARGVSAAANLGIPLGRALSLRWGAQYQHYAQTSIFGFEQKRVYLALRFTPDSWKISR